MTIVIGYFVIAIPMGTRVGRALKDAAERDGTQ
jgi:hypothetical protein